MASALARRAREGAFTTAERDRAIKNLNRDIQTWIVVELTPSLLRDAQALIARHPLRTGDALQLASCLYVQQESGQRFPFAAFDDRLNAAAKAEGLTLLPFD